MTGNVRRKIVISIDGFDRVSIVDGSITTLDISPVMGQQLLDLLVAVYNEGRRAANEEAKP